MKLLAIESSCDETGVAIVAVDASAETMNIQVLAHALNSQASIHAQYGGVFPTVAKREHAKNAVPLLISALRDAQMLSEVSERPPQEIIGELMTMLEREQELFVHVAMFAATYGKPDIDAIAVTYGPGLEPALWVGVNFAKALAKLWNVPLIPINHMEGHIYAALITGSAPQYTCRTPEFPLLSLLVSGAHSELVLSESLGTYTVLGSTRDDAAGECFDKCARLLGLPYPGGPHISRLAAEARRKQLPREFILPRPMIHDTSLDCSFSGLKTALLRITEKYSSLTDEQKEQLSSEVEDAIVEVLVKKSLVALERTDARTLVVSGGVSANTHLSAELARYIAAQFPDVSLRISPRALSTDNALMIACAATPYALRKQFTEPELIQATGNLSLQRT
jgi:N6-L-threonylcarbamoyladenine synthase